MPSSVTCDKPLALGMAVLDLSKLHMWKFHYEVMMPAFGRDNMRVLYTDTDSLLNITGVDPYERMGMQDMRQHFDASDYPR